MNKKILVPAIVLGLAASGAIAWKTGIANAYFTGSTDSRGKMAEELAAKLNVSTDQVTNAMDQIQAEHRTERKAEVSTKLDQAVKDGAINAEQKQKILDKMAENQVNRGEMKGQSGQHRAEMEQWYKDNGIDFEKIHNYIGFGQGRGKSAR